MGDIASKIRDMEETEQAKKRPVSPNLDVSNILYDHYMAAALNGLMGSTTLERLDDMKTLNKVVQIAHITALLAINKRNEK